MDTLLWWSIAVGLLGGAAAFRRGRRSGGVSEKSAFPSFALIAISLPLLIFLVTRFDYFSRGGAWAQGFLLGGAGAVLASWLLLHAIRDQSDDNNQNEVALRSAISGAMAIAIVTAALPLISRATAIETLLGAAMGWAIVFVLLIINIETESKPCKVLFGAHFIVIAGFAVLLHATTALGIYRDNIYSTAIWSTLALVIGASIVLALLGNDWLAARRDNNRAIFTTVSIGDDDAANSPQRNLARGWRLIFSLLFAAVFMGICVAGVLRFDEAWPRVLTPPLLGLAGGLLLCRLARDETSSTPNLAALLLVAGAMTAYLLLQGFGVGLLLLAAMLPIALFLPVAENPHNETSMREASMHLARLTAFGATILIFHLSRTRFREELRDATFNDHYALLGFLVGALLPALIVRAWPEKASAARQIFGLGFGILMALLIVTTLLLIWGAKCVPALMIGLALACVLTNASKTMLMPLLSLFIALMLAQWAGDIVPFADLPRLARIQILAGATTGVALLYALYHFAARWSARSAQDRVL